MHGDEQIHINRSGPGIGSGPAESAGLSPRQEPQKFTRRSGHYEHRYPKLSAVCDTANHPILGVVADRSPYPDRVGAKDFADFIGTDEEICINADVSPA